MAIKKPYHRLYRPMIEGRYGGDYQHDYNFAKDPTHYTRSFFMIQEDIKKLFRYIEPADQNLQTYSLEIYQLLLRTATEIEANFKAILRENEYNKSQNLNIHDYKKINHSHHLDAYSAEFPIWTGEKRIYSPFKPWRTKDSLNWYMAYNQCKHDRIKNLHFANFENLLNAYCGLFILLCSQFGSCSYEPGPVLLCLGQDSNYYHGDFGLGDYLIIHYPTDWAQDDYYDFDWNELKNTEKRFSKFDYNIIK